MGRKAVAKAERARETARAAVTDAAQLGDLLGADRRAKLDEAAVRLSTVVEASEKKVAAHPKRWRRRLEDATGRVEKRAARARRRLARDAAAGGPAVDAAALAAAQASVTPSGGLESETLFELRERARKAGHAEVGDLSRAQILALLAG